MNKYVVQQRLLNLSACQRLCGASSAQTEKLAWQAGWRGLAGDPLQIPVSTAINMLVLSIGVKNGMELDAMGGWLPGLRNEALLKLAVDHTNWTFQGSKTEDHDFWPILFGDSAVIRSRVAPLIDCCLATTTRQLRFHSQRDVEYLSNLQFEQRLNSERPPLFTIDAHDIARQVMDTGSPPFFHAKPKPI